MPTRTWRAIAGGTAIALLLGGAGTFLIVKGTQTEKPASAPLPSATFTTTAGKLPALREPITEVADGPNQLRIPSLKVKAEILPEKITGDELTIPGDVSKVGRSLAQAPLTARRGTTLLAGHVHYTGQGDGALSSLHRVRPGAAVVVSDALGRESAWRVVSLASYRKAGRDLPDELFATTGRRLLAIVTCGGTVQKLPDGKVGYPDNVVAMAVPYRPKRSS